MQKYAQHSITGIDLKNGNDCRKFFQTDDTHYDLVLHLAAIVGGRATIEGQPLAVATDLSIDAELCQWAMRTRPSRLVYFSSSAAYPIRLQQSAYQLKESDINLNCVDNPDMTYGWAKLTGEYCLQFIDPAHTRVMIFRPFSGYGTDQDLAYPFPSYIDRARRRADPFDIWGDGTQVRDFIHIVDVVNAVAEAIQQDVTGPINLGAGIPVSFNDLCQMVCEQSGYTPQIQHHLDAPVGVFYRCSDNRKMLSFYQPRISLEEGIYRALKNQL
jgi:nucleoside-diphosphate-sugar epimerase